MKVYILRGDKSAAHEYVANNMKRNYCVIDEDAIIQMLTYFNSSKVVKKLVLSVRDNTMIKCLRLKKNVFMIGDFYKISDIARIDEVLDMQGQLDNTKYNYKVIDVGQEVD